MHSESKSDLTTQTLEALANTSLRVTQPRRRLIELMASATHPLSAEELYQASEMQLDLVTIYRNMSVFVEYGVVQLIQLENGKQLFELTPQGDHFHHIVCRKCHHTERLELCFGAELERYATGKGYSSVNHVIEVYGLCKNCR
jgi:Fe2+ or Zn2+ uptake regulation protein